MAMRGRSFPCPKTLPGFGPDRLGRRRARRRRRRARALHAGVHVGLVVVADEEHVVVALEHARQAPESDVDGPAVAGLGDDADVVPSLHLQRRGDAGRDRRRVAEQRVEPGDPPRGLRVGGGEHLEASGGVDGDQLAARSPASPRRGRSGHPGPRRNPGTPGVRSRASWSGRVGLDGPIVVVEEAVADGETSDLVEADGLAGHGAPQPIRERRCRGREGRSPPTAPSAGPGHPGALALDHLVVEVEEGEPDRADRARRQRASPRAIAG